MLAVNEFGVCNLDMDGVLAGFEVWAFNNVGPEWKAQIDKPMWGDFVKFPKLYRELPVLEGANEIYAKSCEIFGKDRISILTALPNRAREYFVSAAEDKIYWARKHIDPDIRVSFGPFAKDKQHHCRKPQDVLIDDMAINIDQWNAKGGIGILHSEHDVAKTLAYLETLRHGNS